MASRHAPAPDPGIAGEFGARALTGAITFGLVVPIIQHIGWVMLVNMPSSSEVLTQPPNVWLYIAVLGILPPLAFVLGVAQAASEAGIVGGFVYFLMSLAGQQLFGNPVLAVLAILGLMLGLFMFLAAKIVLHSGSRRRRGRRGR